MNVDEAFNRACSDLVDSGWIEAETLMVGLTEAIRQINAGKPTRWEIVVEVDGATGALVRWNATAVAA